MQKNTIIYKYTKVSERVIKNLINDRISFANSKKFNDPFDSTADIEYRNKTRDLLDNYLIDKVKNKEKEKFINLIMDHEDELLNTNYKSTFQTEEWYISCFSSEYNNNLMWSHYADYHRGICICYELNEEILNKNGYLIRKVEYRSNRYIYNIFINKLKESLNENFQWKSEKIKRMYLDACEMEKIDKNIINDIIIRQFLVKEACWEYEDEIRLIISIPGNDNDYYKAVGSSIGIKLKKVYLGYKLENKNKLKLMKILNNKHIDIYEMKRERKGKYTLIPYKV